MHVLGKLKQANEYKHSKQTARISHTTVTAICIQAQTANIFARLFTFETGRLLLETEMFHCSCDVLQCKA
jgi:hypothetical protein